MLSCAVLWWHIEDDIVWCPVTFDVLFNQWNLSAYNNIKVNLEEKFPLDFGGGGLWFLR